MADTPPPGPSLAQPASKKAAKKKRRKKKDGAAANAAGAPADADADAVHHTGGGVAEHLASLVGGEASAGAERKVRPGKEPAWNDDHSSLQDFWAKMDAAERDNLSRIDHAKLLGEIKTQKKQLCLCSSCIKQRNLFALDINSLFDEFIGDLKDGATTVPAPEATGAPFDYDDTLAVDDTHIFLREDVRSNKDDRLFNMLRNIGESRERQLAVQGTGPDNISGSDASDVAEKNESELDNLLGMSEFGTEESLNVPDRKILAKRMFQLIITKKLELRIMASYRDKVALEKQQLLIQEEEEEGRVQLLKEQQREAAKQKKKQKRERQKQNQLEEKRRQEDEEAKLHEQQRKVREKEEKQREEDRERRRQELAAKEAERLKAQRREEEQRRQRAKEDKLHEVKLREEREAQRAAHEAERQAKQALRQAADAQKAEKQAEKGAQKRAKREAKEADKKADQQRVSAAAATAAGKTAKAAEAAVAQITAQRKKAVVTSQQKHHPGRSDVHADRGKDPALTKDAQQRAVHPSQQGSPGLGLPTGSDDTGRPGRAADGGIMGDASVRMPNPKSQQPIGAATRSQLLGTHGAVATQQQGNRSPSVVGSGAPTGYQGNPMAAYRQNHHHHQVAHAAEPELQRQGPNGGFPVDPHSPPRIDEAARARMVAIGGAGAMHHIGSDGQMIGTYGGGGIGPDGRQQQMMHNFARAQYEGQAAMMGSPGPGVGMMQQLDCLPPQMGVHGHGYDPTPYDREYAATYAYPGQHPDMGGGGDRGASFGPGGPAAQPNGLPPQDMRFAPPAGMMGAPGSPGAPTSATGKEPFVPQQLGAIGSGRRVLDYQEDDDIFVQGSAGLLSPEPLRDGGHNNSWAELAANEPVQSQWPNPADPIPAKQKLPPQAQAQMPPSWQQFPGPAPPPAESGVSADPWGNTPAARQ